MKTNVIKISVNVIGNDIMQNPIMTSNGDRPFAVNEDKVRVVLPNWNQKRAQEYIRSLGYEIHGFAETAIIELTVNYNENTENEYINALHAQCKDKEVRRSQDVFMVSVY